MTSKTEGKVYKHDFHCWTWILVTKKEDTQSFINHWVDSKSIEFWDSLARESFGGEFFGYIRECHFDDSYTGLGALKQISRFSEAEV